MVAAAAQLGHGGMMNGVYRSVRAEQAQAAATAMDGQRPEEGRMRAVGEEE